MRHFEKFSNNVAYVDPFSFINSQAVFYFFSGSLHTQFYSDKEDMMMPPLSLESPCRSFSDKEFLQASSYPLCTKNLLTFFTTHLSKTVSRVTKSQPILIGYKKLGFGTKYLFLPWPDVTDEDSFFSPAELTKLSSSLGLTFCSG